MADTLRPHNWDEYIGQERLKQELEIRIESAIVDERPLDHILLCGPAGVGKTSLAAMIAERLGEPFQVLTMPVTVRALIRTLSDFAGVLLLDELHRCSAKEQEVLLPLLEFGYVADTAGRTVETGWVTIVGATTERRDLIEPLRDRFPIQPSYDDYSDQEMALIVLGMAAKADVSMDDDVALAFGRAATGTPRKARQLVIGYRDLLNTLRREPTIDEVFDLCQVANDGLTTRHLRYLETLRALGGTKGLTTLCSLLRESPQEIMELERLLLKQRLIELGERGRELTRAGLHRLGGGPDKTNPRHKVA